MLKGILISAVHPLAVISVSDHQRSSHSMLTSRPSSVVSASVLGAQRVDGEVVSVPMIVKRVEHDLEPVVVGQRIVAAPLASGDRPRVVAPDGKIEAVVGDQNPDFGADRRRFVDARLLLHEIADWLGALPGRLVESAIDNEGAGRARRDDGFRRQCVRLRGSWPGATEQHRRHDRGGIRAETALALCGALAIGASALAHPLSVSYAHVAVGDTRIVLTVRLPLDDMDLLLRLDRDLDGTVSDREIQNAAPALFKYVTERVSLTADGASRAAATGHTRRWADSAGFPYVETVVEYPGDSVPSRLSLQITVLADLYGDHRTLTDIEWSGRREQFVFQHANTFDGASGSSAWWEHTRTFLVLGFEHILTGYDHLLFLLGLLVAGRSVRELVAIVTSFTIAHSLTLGAATFGLVTPPARVIEAVIALSIAYVGIENLITREPRGRWKLTFAFGLVHGFGFANVLREMELPREALATSLFTFNAGVEVGQLAVVLIAWPMLRWVQSSAYTTPVTRGVSAVVTACGLFWFVQRVM